MIGSFYTDGLETRNETHTLRERGCRVLTIEFTGGHWIEKINSEVEGSWLPYIRTTTLTIVVGKDRPPS